MSTSSPGLIPQARRASSSASVPDATPTAWRGRQNAANSRSGAATSWPRTNWPLATTRRMARSIAGWMARYCAFKSMRGIGAMRFEPLDGPAQPLGKADAALPAQQAHGLGGIGEGAPDVAGPVRHERRRDGEPQDLIDLLEQVEHRVLLAERDVQHFPAEAWRLG